MQPLLSIIIPAYNVEKYLKQCLDSVIKQDNGKIEIILVNDGSTDSTWQICCDYAEHYPLIHAYTKDNGGLSAARNFGIKKSNGMYVNFLDSDDYLPDGAIENICNRLIEQPEIVIGLYDNLYEITGQVSFCGYHLDKNKVESLTGESLLVYLMSGRIYDWYVWLLTVNKTYLLDHKGYFCEGVLFEDARWTPNILLHAKKIAYIDAPLYIYRRNRIGSITATFSKNAFLNKLDLFHYMESFSKEQALSDETKKALFVNMSNLYVSTLFETWSFSKAERKQYLQILKSYKFILSESARTYHRLLNIIWNIFGVTFVSYLLFLRAEWVRKKKIK